MTLINSNDATVPVIVQTRSAVNPEHAFDIIAPIDLPLIFTAWGPLPGVLGVSNQTGEWDHVGASRNPDLSDGSTATEKLTEYTTGHSFAYELTEFTGALRHLVEGVRGEWTFAPDGAETLIRWAYEFKPLPGRRLLVRWGLAPVWRRYMQRSIEAAAHVAEDRESIRSTEGVARPTEYGAASAS